MDMDITESDIYERLINASIRFVSYRPRSEKEIKDFLELKLKRSHTSALSVIKKVIDRMIELGYIDDVAFTKWWVDQRTGRKPKGERVIMEELTRKGIDASLIKELIPMIMRGDRSERALALSCTKKKVNILKNKPILEQKQKLSAYLLRRGFSSDTVWSVVDDVLKKE